MIPYVDVPTGPREYKGFQLVKRGRGYGIKKIDSRLEIPGIFLNGLMAERAIDKYINSMVGAKKKKGN